MYSVFSTIWYYSWFHNKNMLGSQHWYWVEQSADPEMECNMYQTRINRQRQKTRRNRQGLIDKDKQTRRNRHREIDKEKHTRKNRQGETLNNTSKRSPGSGHQHTWWEKLGQDRGTWQATLCALCDIRRHRKYVRMWFIRYLLTNVCNAYVISFKM